MTDVVGVGDIGVEHIHPFQQRVVEVGQLGILESPAPVVGHQLIVRPDGEKTVGIDLMRIDGEEIVHRRNGLAEVAPQQLCQYEVECFVMYHFHPFTFSPFLLSRAIALLSPHPARGAPARARRPRCQATDATPAPTIYSIS